jgi:hypothetical protein
MIDLDSIQGLIELYSSHEWTLRRILLRPEENSTVSNELRAAIKDVEIRSSRIDAIWFSRANNSAESWELRLLGGLPYALVRFVPSEASGDEREAILSEAEIEIETSRTTPTEH